MRRWWHAPSNSTRVSILELRIWVTFLGSGLLKKNSLKVFNINLKYIPIVTDKQPPYMTAPDEIVKELNADSNNIASAIIKSASTPASLQTIVRLSNGSNMSLHHKVCAVNILMTLQGLLWIYQSTIHIFATLPFTGFASPQKFPSLRDTWTFAVSVVSDST